MDESALCGDAAEKEHPQCSNRGNNLQGMQAKKVGDSQIARDGGPPEEGEAWASIGNSHCVGAGDSLPVGDLVGLGWGHGKSNTHSAKGNS